MQFEPRFLLVDGIDRRVTRGEGERSSSEDDREEYVMWGSRPGASDSRSSIKLEELDGGELKGVVVRIMAEWHPTLRRLVQMTDPSTIRPLTVKPPVL